MCCLFGLLDYGHSLTAAQKNHILAVLSTGAYNYSMSSHYNRNQTPPVVMVKDGKSRLIVKGDSLEDIVRNDI